MRKFLSWIQKSGLSFLAGIAWAAETTQLPASKSLTIEYGAPVAGNGGSKLVLDGEGARQQVLATALSADGTVRDLTQQIEWATVPDGIIQVSRSGLITLVADGEAQLIAKHADAVTASLTVQVKNSHVAAPMNFANQVVPIFTKLGCNSGGCHGKSGGQNGFQLSLLGFEPAEDIEHLVKESRGRRIFPAAPDQSLLLLKAIGVLPHGGGQRLEADSRDYQLIRRWISQGMPYGKPTDPTLTRLDVYPRERTLERGGRQQLIVTAYYSDGKTEDVTGGAQFESNDKDIAQTDPLGLVKVVGRSGEVAVMVRYQTQVAVFRANIPLGAPVARLPQAQGFIDELVFRKLKTMGLPPSEVGDDTTFIRRVTLDIAGRLPTAAETRQFLEDTRTDKRNNHVEALLASPEYAEYFANKWSSLLRNRRNTDKEARTSVGFYNWIRDSLADNQPYNQFVQEIITASGDMSQNPPATWYRQVKDTTSQLEDVAQLFMATRMKCAQCHHHPYEKWSQDDYFRLGAFFSQVGRKAGEQPGEEFIYHKRGVALGLNKKTNQKVKPAALGEKALDLSADTDPREALASWLGSTNNPFLAKALVNRYWKHFFNRGLVEPEDDIRDTNPPTNPELLNALAQDFVQSGFDLKHLIRIITGSTTYQLSSIPNEFNAQDKQFYSRYYPKRLTAEVLLDSINEFTDSPSTFAGMQAGTKAVQLPDNSFNASSYFLTVFGRPEGTSACECERSQDASLAQSLHLLNSKDIQAKISANAGRADTLASDASRPDEAKLADLYYLAFSRAPRGDEVKTALQHLAKRADPRQDEKAKTAQRRQAYEDILWALMSSKEFLFNH